MQRKAEPELMDGYEQARAYALADFSGPNSLFLQLFQDSFTTFANGTILDLGCGPADICILFAGAYPACHVFGVDGSKTMLACAAKNIADRRLTQKITLLEGLIPEVKLPAKPYSAIISNSLLHHLPDPMILWKTITSYAKTGTAVQVMDLIRPPNEAAAQAIVTQYAANEPEVLQTDFYHSLLAAYRIEEVEGQLDKAGLSLLLVRQVSDRHLAVSGICR